MTLSTNLTVRLIFATSAPNLQLLSTKIIFVLFAYPGSHTLHATGLYKHWHDVAIQDALSEFNTKNTLPRFLGDFTKTQENILKKDTIRHAFKTSGMWLSIFHQSYSTNQAKLYATRRGHLCLVRFLGLTSKEDDCWRSCVFNIAPNQPKKLMHLEIGI